MLVGDVVRGVRGRDGVRDGEGAVNVGKQISAGVLDVDPRGGAGVGDDEDGGGDVDADAVGEGLVGVDFVVELALRVDGEGEGDAVLLREPRGEFDEHVGVVNGGLVGEDLIAVFAAELLAFQVKPACADGGEAAPGVVGDEEVVADPGDVVLGGGLDEGRVGVGAGGALEVVELDDGDARAGWRAEGRAVLELGGLGAEAGGREKGGAGQGKDEQARAKKRAKGRESKSHVQPVGVRQRFDVDGCKAGEQSRAGGERCGG